VSVIWCNTVNKRNIRYDSFWAHSKNFRFQSQVSGKTCKDDFKNFIFLQFIVKIGACVNPTMGR
jgi:hypothetical protein